MSTADKSLAKTTVRYQIEAKGSTFKIRAFATGMLSAFAHSPTIAIPDFAGDIVWNPEAVEQSSLRLVVRAQSLTVVDDISDKDREEINRRMHSEVLETNGFEEVIYECHRLSTVQKTGEGQYAATLDGELILHGVQRNHAITARINVKDDSLRAAGDFTVRLSDYEIKPVSAAGGTIKLKDDLKLSFDIIARRQSSER